MPRPQRALAALAVTFVTALGCSQTETGLSPATGDSASELQEARFAKRLYLDLTGAQPSDAQLDEAVAQLAKGRDSVKARDALASTLLAQPGWSALYVAELENRLFAGGSVNDVYDFLCPILAGADAACAGKCPFANGDYCDCTCPTVKQLKDERASLGGSADALTSGAETTGEVERNYAAARIFQLNAGSPEGISTAVWMGFLGRKIEADELRNAKALAQGALIPNTDAGLVFHRVGATYDDLVDIVFTSEVYREAAVNAVFQRYLGRPATPPELSRFVGELDEGSPDVRPVVRAVVSSREYFEQ